MTHTRARGALGCNAQRCDGAEHVQDLGKHSATGHLPQQALGAPGGSCGRASPCARRWACKQCSTAAQQHDSTKGLQLRLELGNVVTGEGE
jgi:hypothetical protein